MQPIPCSNCGMNFMRRSINPEDLKLCNNCDKKEVNKMNINEVEILIRCDRQTQIDIEEICLNEGISFSEYFFKLHHNKNNTGIIHRETIPCEDDNIVISEDDLISNDENIQPTEESSKVSSIVNISDHFSDEIKRLQKKNTNKKSLSKKGGKK